MEDSAAALQQRLRRVETRFQLLSAFVVVAVIWTAFAPRTSAQDSGVVLRARGLVIVDDAVGSASLSVRQSQTRRKESGLVPPQAWSLTTRLAWSASGWA